MDYIYFDIIQRVFFLLIMNFKISKKIQLSKGKRELGVEIKGLDVRMLKSLMPQPVY